MPTNLDLLALQLAGQYGDTHEDALTTLVRIAIDRRFLLLDQLGHHGLMIDSDTEEALVDAYVDVLFERSLTRADGTCTACEDGTDPYGAPCWACSRG
jgi:hypothetical protein